MFGEPVEYDSDLEWMLQSGQVSDEVLVEALVRETYPQVYRLAWSLLDEPDVARRIALETYTAALLNIYRYRSHTGVLPWLFSLTIGLCRRELLRRQARQAAKRSRSAGQSAAQNLRLGLQAAMAKMKRQPEEGAPVESAAPVEDLEATVGESPEAVPGEAELPPDPALDEPREPEAGARAEAEAEAADSLEPEAEQAGADQPKAEGAPARDAEASEAQSAGDLPPGDANIDAAPAGSSDPDLTPDPETILRRAFDATPLRQRLPYLLYLVHDQPVEAIGKVLRVREAEEAQRAIDAGRSAFLDQLGGEGLAQVPDMDLRPQYVDARMAAILQARWPVPEVSAAETDEIIAASIARARQTGTLRRRFNAVRELVVVGVAVVLVAAAIWAVNVFSPPSDTPGAGTRSPFGFSEQPGVARPGGPTPTPDRRRHTAVYLSRPGDSLETIADRLGVPPAGLTGPADEINLDGRLLPGQPVLVDLDLLPDPPLEPTPVTPVPRLNPLDLDTDPQAVQELIEHSFTRWRTLWLDAQMIEYGPSNYIGPARAYRLQTWVNPPEESLELWGLLEGPPRWSYLASRGTLFFSSGDNRQTFAEPYWAASPVELPGSPRLQALVYPASGNAQANGSRMDVLEEAEVAGRAALVVDWIDPDGWRESRLWVDAQTGVILRRQQFSLEEPQVLLSDLIVTRVDYDRNFPPELFDPQMPWQGGYAIDYRAEPDPDSQEFEVAPTLAVQAGRPRLLHDTPPAGFDPSQSTLAFQAPDPGDAPPALGQSVRPFELFADGYYLGTVDFGVPWNLICTRSPDGQRLAFSVRPDGFSLPDSDLRWFNLTDPSEVFVPMPGFVPSAFAFSPDGRSLAVAGYGTGGQPSGVYQVKLGSGEVVLLAEIDQGSSLVWSPDGEYLALINSETPQDGELLVIRVPARQVIYRQPLNLPRFSIPEDAPVHGWGVAFPVEMGGMETCGAP